MTRRPEAVPKLGPAQWTSVDGKVMPYRSWQTPAGTPARAVVIAVHGLSGAASDFWLLGERLPAKGIAVYGCELRGQGNDPSVADRGDIRSSRQWLNDLRALHRLVQAQHPGVPVIWYGESLGALIALHAAADNNGGAAPAGLVLASPLAGLRQHLSSVERSMLLMASRIAPAHRVKLGDVAHVDENAIQVTRTTTHGGQMSKTPHHVAAFSLRLLREIYGLMKDNESVASRIKVPVLVIASPNDKVVSADSVQDLFRQLGSDQKKMLWYAQSFHLLLHDVQRDVVMRDVSNWLREREK